MTATIEGFGNNGAESYSDASAHTLYAEPATENIAGWRSVRVLARRVSDGAAKLFLITYGFKRDSGDASIFGMSSSVIGETLDLVALALVSAVVDVDGSDVRIRCTGLASTEIDWAFSSNGDGVVHA